MAKKPNPFTKQGKENIKEGKDDKKKGGKNLPPWLKKKGK